MPLLAPPPVVVVLLPVVVVVVDCRPVPDVTKLPPAPPAPLQLLVVLFRSCCCEVI